MRGIGEKYTCPHCGFYFDINYGRIFACGDCEGSVLGDCGFARCPKCGHEFAIYVPEGCRGAPVYRPFMTAKKGRHIIKRKEPWHQI
ncbi:MAG: hypothetical protein ACUVUE_03040 [Candidatus Bathycorpusculaceae bacterium]